MRLSFDRAMVVFAALLAAEVVWVALPGLPAMENPQWGGIVVVLLLVWNGWARRSRRALNAVAVLWALMLLMACLLLTAADDLEFLVIAVSFLGLTAAELGAVLLARSALSQPS